MPSRKSGRNVFERGRAFVNCLETVRINEDAVKRGPITDIGNLINRLLID